MTSDLRFVTLLERDASTGLCEGQLLASAAAEASETEGSPALRGGREPIGLQREPQLRAGEDAALKAESEPLEAVQSEWTSRLPGKGRSRLEALVESFIRRNPKTRGCREDLHQEAWIALDRALRAHRAEAKDDLGKYVSAAVWRALIDYSKREARSLDSVDTSDPLIGETLSEAVPSGDVDPGLDLAWCEVCGDSLMGKRSDATTCSERCRKRKARGEVKAWAQPAAE